MIEVIKGDEHRIGMPDHIYIGIQCGCGWSVIAWSPRNDESHHDLYDHAEIELRRHIERAQHRDKCQPWLT
jgi:hypothetical protein